MTPDEFIEKWMSRRETDINLAAMRADLEEMMKAAKREEWTKTARDNFLDQIPNL